MSWQVRMRPDGVEKGPIVRVGFSVLAAANSADALVRLIVEEHKDREA